MFALFLFALYSCTNAISVRKDTILPLSQSIKCSICHILVTYVEEFIQRNQSEAFIIRELNNLCKALPSGFGPACTQIVSEYAPKIISWIVNKEDPDKFCLSVGLCTSDNVEILPVKVEQSRKEEIVKKETTQTVGCTICQTVVLYVEKWIQENSTEQAIIDRLETFCSALGSVAPECRSIVATYLPSIIQHILNKEDPLTFCTQVRLCTTVVNRAEIEKRAELQGGCEICQMIVTYVEQLVQQNNTIAVIVAKVEDLCNLLPASVRPICDQIAVKYVPELVAWIVKKENPQAFCAHFGLC